MAKKRIVLEFDSEELYNVAYKDLIADTPEKEEATITETDTEVIVQIHKFE